jgi:hypothetical protein
MNSSVRAKSADRRSPRQCTQAGCVRRAKAGLEFGEMYEGVCGSGEIQVRIDLF